MKNADVAGTIHIVIISRTIYCYNVNITKRNILQRDVVVFLLTFSIFTHK